VDHPSGLECGIERGRFRAKTERCAGARVDRADRRVRLEQGPTRIEVDERDQW
jgi:hypothetical protein